MYDRLKSVNFRILEDWVENVMCSVVEVNSILIPNAEDVLELFSCTLYEAAY